MRIGIDLGGTKIEAIALDGDGRERFRQRIATPRGDYAGTVEAVATLDGAPVAARQGSVMVASFHPELTSDRRLHARFASMVMSRGVVAA